MTNVVSFSKNQGGTVPPDSSEIAAPILDRVMRMEQLVSEIAALTDDVLQAQYDTIWHLLPERDECSRAFYLMADLYTSEKKRRWPTSDRWEGYDDLPF